MGRYLRLEATPVAHTFYDTRHEGGAVQHAHLARYADICIDQRIIVRDHVFIWRVRGHRVLEGIGRAPEELAPQRAVDQMEEGDNPERTIGGRRGGG